MTPRTAAGKALLDVSYRNDWHGPACKPPTFCICGLTDAILVIESEARAEERERWRERLQAAVEEVVAQMEMRGYSQDEIDERRALLDKEDK